MPKTPDEIKKGLECCKSGIPYRSTCAKGCPYKCDCSPSKVCASMMMNDALALIQQLQAQNAEKDARIQQLEAERDAAVADIGEMVMQIGFIACEWCDHCDCESDCDCLWSSSNPGFKWRGVQKED